MRKKLFFFYFVLGLFFFLVFIMYTNFEYIEIYIYIICINKKSRV